MSFFNESNDLASELVRDRTYQGDEACFPIEKIVFYRDLADAEDRIIVTNDGSGWAAIASRIHQLVAQGYDYTTLPCQYCGATDIEDVFHCDGCGDAVPHGEERAFTDASGGSGTVCGRCHRNPESLWDAEL